MLVDLLITDHERKIAVLGIFNISFLQIPAGVNAKILKMKEKMLF